MSSTTLTGIWHGHYTQYGIKRPIIAKFVQEGERISGEMTDVDTDIKMSLYDAVAKSGLPPGTDEQIAEQIQQMIPDADDNPIMTRSVLPESSTLDGTVKSELVRFTKRYQGESIHTYEIGDKGVASRTPGHEVEYSGRLSQDRNRISGRWTIYQPTALSGFIDGSFQLERRGSSS